MLRTEMIDSYAGRNDLIKESLTLGLQQLARDIGYERSQGLQRLLLDNVLTCWIHLQTIQNESEAFWKKGFPNPQSGNYLDKRLNRAQQRFLRACKAIEDSRRKLGPCVQVNVADQQVNISACATNE